MKSLGIGMTTLGLAVAIYSYGVGFPTFIAGIVVLALGLWLALRAKHVHA